MTKYYSDLDIEYDGNFYEDRLVDFPSINRTTPEFLAGVAPAVTTSINLSNIDKSLTVLRANQQFRGKRVEISELYALDGNIENTDPSNLHIYRTYVGIVDNSSVGINTATLNATTQGLDVLDIPFPIRRVTTDLFPNALDLDVPVPFIIGTGREIPLPLVYVNETPSSIEFKYLVGHGSLSVTNVYRDKRLITAYSGTAQSGSTSTTLKLSASDTKSDDFYNEAYVEIVSGTGAGQVRKITDYVKSSKVATVTPSWTTTPNNTSVYKIREWGPFTETVDGQVHTFIKFAITQRDDSNSIYQMDRMYADVAGLQTERHPARAVNTILSLVGETVDTVSLSLAVSLIDAIGGLYVDGAVFEDSTVGEVLDKICLIGRLFPFLASDGEYELEVVRAKDVLSGSFDDEDNIADLTFPSETSLFDMWKEVSVSYRRLCATGSMQLTSAARAVDSTGKISQVIENEFIDDKTTADKVTDFLAKVKVAQDKPFQVSVGNEGRGVDLFSTIKLHIPNYEVYEELHTVTGIQVDAGVYTFTVVPILTSLADYDGMTLPSDPVTDSLADYRFTPPDPVTGFAVVWSVTSLNVSAKATLSWTNPTSNFSYVILEYKRTVDSLYTAAYEGNGTSFAIAGLTPGTSYDFRITTYNIFDLDGGVVSITSSLAPGDTTAPAVPTGLNSDVKFGQATWKWTKVSDSDLFGYDYDIRTASGGGGTLLHTGFSTDPQVTWTLLTSAGTVPSLTTVVSNYLRVRSKDFAGNLSAYTTAVIATSNSIDTGDIDDGAVDENKRIVVYTHTETGTMLPLAPQQGSHSFRSFTHGLGKIPLTSLHLTLDSYPAGLIRDVYLSYATTTDIGIVVRLFNGSSSSFFPSGIDWTLIIKYW